MILFCDFVWDGESFVCSRCGVHKQRKTIRNCSGPVGLGDYVAAFAAAFGVPECEKCTDRKRRLNKIRLRRK